MSKLAFLTSGTGVTVGAGAAVVTAVAVAGYFGGVFSTEQSAAPLPMAQPAPIVETVKPLEQSAEVSAEPAPKAPKFDVVRVEPDGAAMIAGNAEAGSDVSIRVDDVVVAQVKADGSGKFASFLTLPESQEPRVLTLDANAGGAGSEQVFITPTAAVEVAEAAVEMIEEPQPEPVLAIEQPAKIEPKPKQPVVVMASKEGGVRVLQTPDAPKPDAMTALLASISYDDAGDVALTGNSDGEFVRIYLDNRPITTSQIASNGDWQAGLPEVDTGIYTLRVDELNEAGAVVARVETPFKREEPEVLNAARTPDKAIEAITVQPGATLWAIAQERYGSGTLYARLVQANADTIRDPDLIYPGQVFTVPE